MSIDEMIMQLQMIKEKIGGNASVIYESDVGGTFTDVGFEIETDMADNNKYLVIYGW